MDKETKHVLKGTKKALRDITMRWYADCFNTERDMQRLIFWETKISALLGNPKK